MGYMDENYADHETNDLLDVATMMDPWFKGQHMKQGKIDAMKMRGVSKMFEETRTFPFQPQPREQEIRRQKLLQWLPTK